MSDGEDGPWTVIVTYTYHVNDCTADTARRVVHDSIAGRSTARQEREHDVSLLNKRTVIHPALSDPFDVDAYFEMTKEQDNQ